MASQFGTPGRPKVLLAIFPIGAVALTVLLWLVTAFLPVGHLPHAFTFVSNPRLFWVRVIADLILWGSCSIIAFSLGRYAILNRRQLPFQQIAISFAIFFVACGFTQLMNMVLLWKPLYWLSSDLKLLTACASLITAATLPFYLPALRRMLRNSEISAENERRFLACTESSLDSFYIFESIRDSSGEIVDFRFVFVNAVAARLISRRPDQIIGQAMCELIPENRPDGFFDKYKRVVETGKPIVDEFRLDMKTVNATWLKFQVIKLNDGVAITTSDITERKLREQTSAENERRFLAAAESSLDSLYLLRSVRDSSGGIVDFRFLFVNTNAARVVGMSPEAMIGQLLCELMPQNRSWGFFDSYRRVAETGEPHVQEFPVEGFDGVSTEWLKIQVVKLDDGVAVTASDISDRKRLEVERTAAFTESLIANSPAAVIVTDLHYSITAINPAVEKMLWYQRGELVGRGTPLMFYDHSEVEVRAKRLSYEFETKVSLDEAIFFVGQLRGLDEEGEWTFRRKGGSKVSVQVTVTPLRSANNQINGFMLTAYDVSERKQREEYISHLAQHDLLTGLPTRQLLMDRLSMMLSRSQRYITKSALLVIDLNNFKNVNDTFGHHIGDLLLVQIAERLSATVRAVDTVARMGGDEFVVLVSDLDSALGAERVATKLLAAFNAPFILNEQATIEMTASIGICVYPDCGTDAAALLRNADIAMYHAKATGRNVYRLFSREIAQLAFQKHEMEAALVQALESGEFQLHYQPQFSLIDGGMVGVEALLRWNSKRLGMVEPARFIPLAEQSGLILPIGAWVIQAACRELRNLQSVFGARLMMAVNLSARQLDQPDLLMVIEQALAENSLDPTTLEIEVTETMLMTDSPNALLFFEGLRKQGIRVAIDDFGTGFSSMSYLLRFSVDRLKIDRCFIRDCSTDANSATVTTAIIALAHQLKLLVLAEGVETREQMDFLRSAGCDDVQGYYLGRPVPPELISAATTV